MRAMQPLLQFLHANTPPLDGGNIFDLIHRHVFLLFQPLFVIFVITGRHHRMARGPDMAQGPPYSIV